MLSSRSSDQDVMDAYADNASYHEDGSVTKARAFVTACRLLLLRLPRMTAHGGTQTQLNPDLVQTEMRKAEEWAASRPDTSAAGGGPRVTRTSFTNFRQ